MRSIRILPPLALLAILAGARPAGAGPYTMDRVAFGNGQTAAVAGSYRLTGGAGVPLMQRATGGPYVLQSGFWALPGSSTTDVPSATDPIVRTGLLRSAPNPFAAQTQLAFELEAARHVSLDVFDIRGARVRALLDRTLDPGRYQLQWDGRAEDGAVVPAGIYWIQFQSGSTRERSRVVRLP